MAITIEAQPQVLTTGFNPIMYYLSSTNVNERSFRFIVEVYISGGGAKLFEKKYPPRPLDGLAEVNISRDIQNFLSSNLPFLVTHNQNATNQFLKFDIKFGEEYIVAWSYSDFVILGGNVGFEQVPNVTPHPFVVGDQIRTQFNSAYGDFRDTINGLHTVVDVPSVYELQTELPWISSGAVSAGKIYYADNRKSRFTNLTNLTNQTAFNGALDLLDFKNYNYINFVPATPSVARLLTNCPLITTQSLSQDRWMAYWNNYASSTKVLWFEDSLGNKGYRSLTASTNNGVVQFPCGLDNLPTLTMTVGTAIDLTSDYVDYWLQVSTDKVTETFRMLIDERCAIEEYSILFFDRLGSFCSFAFNLRSTENGNVTRNSYNKKFGDVNLTSNTFDFTTYDKGDSIYSVDLKKEITLNTNWMSDAESVYFEELMTSGDTFLKIGSNYFACTITDTSFPIERQKNKNLIRKTITVKLAVQTPINI
jgi:hypothetical protein